jgi:hypothetical protein
VNCEKLASLINSDVVKKFDLAEKILVLVSVLKVLPNSHFILPILISVFSEMENVILAYAYVKPMFNIL